MWKITCILHKPTKYRPHHIPTNQNDTHSNHKPTHTQLTIHSTCFSMHHMSYLPTYTTQQLSCNILLLHCYKIHNLTINGHIVCYYLRMLSYYGWLLRCLLCITLRHKCSRHMPTRLAKIMALLLSLPPLGLYSIPVYLYKCHWRPTMPSSSWYLGLDNNLILLVRYSLPRLWGQPRFYIYSPPPSSSLPSVCSSNLLVALRNFSCSVDLRENLLKVKVG